MGVFTMKKMNIGFLGIVLVILVVMASGCTSSDSNSTAPGMSASQVKSNATLLVII